MKTGIGLVCIGFAMFMYTITNLLAVMALDIGISVSAIIAMAVMITGGSIIAFKEDK